MNALDEDAQGVMCRCWKDYSTVGSLQKSYGSQTSCAPVLRSQQGRAGRSFRVGYCTLPVTLFFRDPIKGYIKPYYNYYPTVTEGGQYPNLDS